MIAVHIYLLLSMWLCGPFFSPLNDLLKIENINTFRSSNNFMRYIILFFLIISENASSQPAKTNQNNRPNIIYIMSDDHDAKAISAYDKTLTFTPNIDRIAIEGMRFDR